MARQRNEIGGQRFALLTVGEYLGREGGFLWRCLCDCGATTPAKSTDLIVGKKQSCGCLAHNLTAERNRRHGHSVRGSVSPEYRVYLGMKRRCYNPNNSDYAYYGGRGIRVSDSWLDSFDDFLRDMGPRPEGASIERIDNDGNYEQSNCRWASRKEQMRNRRSTRLVEYQGVTSSLAEAAERAGIPYKVAQSRITHLGWSVEAALSRQEIGRWS